MLDSPMAAAPQDGARPRRRRGPRRRPARKKSPTPDTGPARALRASATALTQSIETPLTPDEIRELQEHFAFLKRHRKLLRLKLNAQEDLLVNGVRTPERRGVCAHLLSKVDRPTVTQALVRMTDASDRLRLLEGVVQFSSDPGFVLDYLELVAATSTTQTAIEAVHAGLQRLDFTRASTAQMRRLLDLLVDLFSAEARPSLVLGLLANPGFRAAFDDAADALPGDLARVMHPLRAAYDALEGTAAPGPTVAAGTVAILENPLAVLRRLGPDQKVRLVEAGLAAPGKTSRACRGLDGLLDHLPKSERTYARLAMARASDLLRSHRDSAAVALLEQVRTHHPQFQLPQRWLEALDQPRVGRFALGELQADVPDVQNVFALDHQRPAWLVWEPGQRADDATHPEATGLDQVSTPAPTTSVAALRPWYDRVAAMGVVVALGAGVHDERAFLVVAQYGPPAHRRGRRARAGSWLGWARDVLEILHALTVHGMVLPDLAWHRFQLGGDRLWLWDLRGVEAVPPAVAEAVAVRQFMNAVPELAQWGRQPVRPDTTRRLATALTLAHLKAIVSL